MRLLYVVHDIPPYELSGTPLHTLQYATHALRAGDRVAVAFAAGAASGCEPIARNDGLLLLPVAVSASDWTLDEYVAPPTDPSALRLLGDFQPDLIHMIDWFNLPATVLAAARAAQVPVIRHICNAEDICAFVSPIRFHLDGRVCQAPLTAGQCAECLTRNRPRHEPAETAVDDAARQADFLAKVAAKWNAFASHRKEIYSRLIFTSDSFRRYFESICDLGHTPRSVIVHGIEPPRAPVRAPVRVANAPIRFLFAGPCSFGKGWDVIQGCFARLLPAVAGRIGLTVYGGAAQVENSPLAGLAGVEFLEPYPSEALDQVFAAHDVGLVPSRFETFGRVCREMLVRGMPIIGSEASGIQDVLRHRHNGLQIGWPTAEGLESAIRLILEEKGLLDKLRAGARLTPIRSAADEFVELRKLYCEHIDAARGDGIDARTPDSIAATV